VQTTMSVIPGQILYIFTGGQGSSSYAGGYNGGGYGSFPLTGAGGGGASDIRIGGNRAFEKSYCCRWRWSWWIKFQLSNSNGGAGGEVQMQEMDGEVEVITLLIVVLVLHKLQEELVQHQVRDQLVFLAWEVLLMLRVQINGGGGGGYFGGGGSYTGGGGGGGSSWVTSTGTSGTVHTQGYQSGNGSIIISWYNTMFKFKGKYYSNSYRSFTCQFCYCHSGKFILWRFIKSIGHFFRKYIKWWTTLTGGTLIGSSASGANFAVSPTLTTLLC